MRTRHTISSMAFARSRAGAAPRRGETIGRVAAGAVAKKLLSQLCPGTEVRPLPHAASSSVPAEAPASGGQP